MAKIEINHPEAVIAALKAEDPRLKDMSEEEAVLVMNMLGEIRENGHSPLLEELWMADFHRKPPTVEEFLYDDYYLGRVTRPDPDQNQLGLIPEWREVVFDAFDPNRVKACSQLIFSGPIGSGKSFCGVVCLLFRLAKCLCMREPLMYYKLSRATKLNFFFLSITREQVMDGAFGDCISMMRESPFFVESSKDDISKQEFKNQRIAMNRNIMIQAGSQARHAIGRNTLGAFMDEVNFRLEKDARAAAKDMHDAIARRTKSRFGDSEDGILVLVSSAKNETDFLAEHIQNNLNNPGVKVMARPFWESMGKYKIAYSGETFKVDIGDTFNNPKILNEGEEVDSLTDEVKSRIWDVPIEHKMEFTSDLPGALKDVAGIGAATNSKVFYNHWPIIQAISEHPDPTVGKDEIHLSIGSNHQIPAFLNFKGLLQMRGTSYSPIRDPLMPRFIHLDMSSGAIDAMGIAMVHPTYKVEVEVIDPFTHLVEKRYAPKFETDFCFGIRRDATGEPIDFGKVRLFIAWLRQHGFPIHTVTADLQSMSQEMLNILKQNGFRAEYLSVDRTKDGYLTLRQIMSEGRLAVHNKGILMSELVNLTDLDKKIDHPAKNTVKWSGDMVKTFGSKDQSDALAGAVFKAEITASSIQLPFGSYESKEAPADLTDHRGDDIPVY